MNCGSTVACRGASRRCCRGSRTRRCGWEKHGIRQAGFWSTRIGKSSQEIIYMLAWESMAEREKRWGAFLTDPEWVAVVAKTERDGQLVENISSQLLTPAAFSAVK
jgi:NIPSNAP